VKGNYENWRPFIEEASLDIPQPYESLGHFHKLIVSSCVSRRKVVSFVRSLVRDTLGEAFVLQTDVDLAAPFGDTSNDTPLLFVLSQGADPRDSLERLAEKKGYSDKLTIFHLVKAVVRLPRG
jgi:dynein heavy chain